MRDEILAGNVTFTAESLRISRRITYRVCRNYADDKTLHFVSVIEDEHKRGKFLGTIFNERTFKVGKFSAYDDQSVEAKTFRWIWNHIDNLCYKPIKITFHRGGQHESPRGDEYRDPYAHWNEEADLVRYAENPEINR